MRIIVFWGLYWGPPILGNCHLHRPYLHGLLDPYSSSQSVPSVYLEDCAGRSQGLPLRQHWVELSKLVHSHHTQSSG